MSHRHLVVFDTPSIKQYVFGTNALREMRGASANLVRLNGIDTLKELEEAFPAGASVDRIYANGGAAQFLIANSDSDQVRKACRRVVAHFMRETVGDVEPVYGVAELSGDNDYPQAIRKAHFELRCRREMGCSTRAAPLIPLMAECASASHLPATGMSSIGGDRPRPLSESSHVKEKRGRYAKEHGIWSEWMKYLASTGTWLDEDQWDPLRCDLTEQIGSASSRMEGYMGIVYADGNAMGQIVQQLNSPGVCRAFSEIVDGSIHTACFEALEEICAPEIAQVRTARDNAFPRLPADILLLGGDDLLVLLPADRAVTFAAVAASRFQSLTQQAIASQFDATVQNFFHQAAVSHFTISCGVAIARSSYPFYLLLDLAEDLLKNAKRGRTIGPGGAADNQSRIDFHIVAGANSFSLSQSRDEDYHVESELPRTLRPFSVTELHRLRESVSQLRAVNFPRSKLHALHESALAESPVQAVRAILDIFGRCKASTDPDRNERLALWSAISGLQPNEWKFDFPVIHRDGQRMLAVADLLDAMDVV